jgi:hypothetical protein
MKLDQLMNQIRAEELKVSEGHVRIAAAGNI